MDAKLEQKFTELYQSQYSSVYFYIFGKIGNKEEAEDLTHDIFLSVYKHFDSYDETKAKLNTWLYVIVNNRLINYYKSRKITADIDELSEIIPDENADLNEIAFYLEQCRDVIADVLEELPEKQRQIIVYKYFDGLKSNEIAEIMGMSAINVRVTSDRAVTKLKEILLKKGYTKEDFIDD